MLLLDRSETLGLFLNTLTADDKYSRHNIGNSLQETEMQLCQKPNNFS